MTIVTKFLAIWVNGEDVFVKPKPVIEAQKQVNRSAYQEHIRSRITLANPWEKKHASSEREAEASDAGSGGGEVDAGDTGVGGKGLQQG